MSRGFFTASISVLFILACEGYFLSLSAQAFTINDSQTVSVTATVLDPEEEGSGTSTSTLPVTSAGSSGGQGGGGTTSIQSPVKNTLQSLLAALRVDTTGLTEAQKLKIITDQVNNLIIYGDEQIANRVSRLTTLYGQIQSNTDLTPSKKKALSLEVKAFIKNIADYQDRIDNDTEPVSLGVTVNSLFSHFRINTLVIPRYTTILAANSVYEAVKKFNDLSDKLKLDISNVKDEKKAASLWVALADLNIQIADAAKQAHLAEDTVITLVADNGVTARLESNKSLLTAALAHVALSTKDMKLALADALFIQNQISAKGAN